MLLDICMGKHISPDGSHTRIHINRIINQNVPTCWHPVGIQQLLRVKVVCVQGEAWGTLIGKPAIRLTRSSFPFSSQFDFVGRRKHNVCLLLCQVLLFGSSKSSQNARSWNKEGPFATTLKWALANSVFCMIIFGIM